MEHLLVADLSRWQFALTAMYHFLFVPLTLGLSMILVIMEGAYVLIRVCGLSRKEDASAVAQEPTRSVRPQPKRQARGNSVPADEEVANATEVLKAAGVTQPATLDKIAKILRH